MESFDVILGLLFKRVSSQNVIDNRIRFDRITEREFLGIATAYISQRSENEALNMYHYLLSICGQQALDSSRRSSSTLNVFELLLHVSGKYLTITNNMIRCRYQLLPAWRRLTVELSEDLLVTAFLAKKLTNESVMQRGFTWQRIISHDNEHLHAVMKRGISENHSHLSGAAPIFHISWLSMMNNITNPAFARIFHQYDSNRRYANIKYSGEYTEQNFYSRYLQAALIRFLLFTKESGKRVKLGNYDVCAEEIVPYLKYPDKEPNVILPEDVPERLEKELGCYPSCDLSKVFNFLVNMCWEEEQPDYIMHKYSLWYFFMTRLFRKSRVSTAKVLAVVGESVGKPISTVTRQLLRQIDRLQLDELEELFADHKVYASLWEHRTLMNVWDMLRDPYKIEMIAGSLQSMIDVMRRESQRAAASSLGQTDYVLGYLGKNHMKEEDPNVIFAGERWLMYQMFEEVNLCKDRTDPLYLNLFYAYLLIKESIRSEMIQSNLNVGFANFQRYQERKSDFIINDVYNNVFTRTAVHDGILSKNMRHMELRFTPSSATNKNLQLITNLDQTIGSSDYQEPEVRERFFYTLHFIKRSEKIYSDLDYYYCRNYRRRELSMRIAHAIAAIREEYPSVGERIFGIDAASNEIGCRPEVFAPAFRYLKAHRHMYRTPDGMKKLPQLRATYHVGEDFLDVADGLRAIDEAIKFLNLGYGDRIGHAIALGIDVKSWYVGKEYKIVLPRQDYLDNLVWVYHKLTEYGIQGFENLKAWIYSEFAENFSIIYGNDEKPQRADIDNYYNAWKLRGDDPALYEKGFFDKSRMEYHRKPWMMNDEFPDEDYLREIQPVAELYYRYHFSERSRKRGEYRKEYTMSKGYVNALVEIQHEMQFDVASRGLAIETNPSSNYHIGTFRSYEEHPIIHFFNKGLVHNEEQIRACPQIPVSINTDDQGVFTTSLENEYALMASALEAVTDERDRKLYHPSDIYEWLDRIRIMGNDQNFAEIYKENDPENRRHKEKKE